MVSAEILSHHIDVNRPRDPTGFFWQDRPSGEAQTASLICAEFRATRERYSGFWLFPMKDELPFEGDVRLEVTAANLAAPIKACARVRLEQEVARWVDDDVLALLEDWIVERLRASL